MKYYTITQAKTVVKLKMDQDSGLFSAYWVPKEMMKLSPSAQVSAMDLFLAAHRVSTYINPQTERESKQYETIKKLQDEAVSILL